MKKLLLANKKILWAGALALLVILMMDFNNRMAELIRLNADKDGVSTRVYSLEQTEQTLRTQIAYATSDIAVEAWARQEGRMVFPGDIPIIPLAQEGSTPQVTPLVVPTPEPVENWEVWQALFFED